ncbi:MAG: 50S ribosomal protein L17 [Prolixibacteraceae bacterium]|jgi:large subunit ribosomal protein L17|nr:50S ribosomal protein L17 [Prolixibacteraceae bacterium]MBT6007249.1 50S ribosomal protein L17 [Prolixibacteraceae bacterium]MBT6766688.1 50S ribosomal protein L17 [Prolixibacteraceae bacterium]MBT6998695.1 50S ribosomal protein L17 [Prolixibacteraceae bacterium]MBT7397496.1 50S ribosomal protein L17 [Prolixibacteraceae bacterium]
MRHNKKFNHLGRTSAHRKAMLANMASSLIGHKRISTTLAKAKALRKYVEPLITKSKSDTTHSRRVVFSYLQDKDAVSELFREIAGKVADRPGGYTRILKTGNRLGDNAEMCIIELVDYNETMLAAKEETAKPKKRRSRRGGAKKVETAESVTETAVADEVEVVEDVQPLEETEAVAETEVKAEDEAEEPKVEKDSAEEKKEE